MLYHVTDWDAAYANTAHIPGGEGFPDRWAAAAADFRARHPPEDAGAGHLFLPDAAPKGLMVFIHGGYWMACAPGDFSHLAAGAIARGWAVLMPGYDKAPAARIARITAQVAGQIAAAAGRIAGPVALTGHSAGGHLAARMICPGVLPDAVLARVRACVPVSGLFDLRPLMRTAMNATLRLTDAEAWAESPALLTPAPVPVPVTAWVGGSERPEFIRQSRLIANIWAGLGVPTECVVDPGLHHFTVIDGLMRPDGPLIRRLLTD